MINNGTLVGSVKNNGTLLGSVLSSDILRGTMVVSGGGSKDAVLYVEQELTEEQKMQARHNISAPGENVTGTVQIPYTVDEPNGYIYYYDEPIEAAEGAEIFNCYSGVSEYGSDRNIATGYMSQASGFRTQAIGNYSKAGGWWTRADGQCSVAEGLLSVTTGHFCHAEGTRTQATINNAHSEGDGTIASGRQSHSEGMQTIASGFCSHAEGSTTEAKNYYSHSEGLGTISAGRNQTAMGKYNISDTSSLLIVGKGSSKTNRSNAFTVSSSGAGWFAGAVTSTGADYAEYFEWSDGNLDSEDRIGLIVTLDGERIRLANSGDDIAGIVSATAIVLGDNAQYEWAHKYVTDEFGRIVYDDPIEEFAEYIDHATGETVRESTGFSRYPKLNLNYDPNKNYINRADRKEWDAVGMLGKLRVRDDGTCVVGQYAEVKSNGFATAAKTKTEMRVMKRINEGVVLVLLK